MQLQDKLFQNTFRGNKLIIWYRQRAIRCEVSSYFTWLRSRKNKLTVPLLLQFYIIKCICYFSNTVLVSLPYLCLRLFAAVHDKRVLVEDKVYNHTKLFYNESLHSDEDSTKTSKNTYINTHPQLSQCHPDVFWKALTFSIYAPNIFNSCSSS